MITQRYIYILFFQIFILLMFPSFSLAIDTLTSSNPLTINQTLVSNGDVYELGFINPANDGNLYIAIWYKNVEPKVYVWVANRDNPITSSSSNSTMLAIGDDGNVVILSNETVTPVWSSNQSVSVVNTVAQLLDDGNFVLRPENNESYFIWQGFDYPTDTLLPGMQLGWTRKDGVNRFLQSWKSDIDPGSGDYTVKMNIDGFPEFFLYKEEREVIYRSGSWNGRRFSGGGAPRMENTPVEYEFVNNLDEITYTFVLKDRSVFSRLFMESSGKIRRLTWVETTGTWSEYWYAPRDRCDNYSECGNFGICDANSISNCKCMKGFRPKDQIAWDLQEGKDGCVRATKLDCWSDGFLALNNTKLPESSKAFVNKTMNLDECREMCKRNCSCTAYANMNITGSGSGCVIWAVDLLDMRQYVESEGSGQDLYVRVVKSDAGPHERSQDFLMKEGNMSVSKKDYAGETTQELELRSFKFTTLAKATNYFSDTHKLGKGGFGCVYKGILKEGEVVAVKRLSKTSGQGIEELRNEVILIAKLQHRNLVRLLGCCIEVKEKLLVYEYMENKSLNAFLFDKQKSAQLNWQIRFNIICGIARGLLYLHQDSRLRIIHRDIKASNIFLDKEMNPKISDFGMARIFWGDQTATKTKKVVGTYGYIAPEYAMDGILSTKSDVFSFGVLVLEIVTGQKNRGLYYASDQHNLFQRTWRSWNEGHPLELLDASIRAEFSQVLRCIQIGLLCVQEHAEDRPSMSKVMLMLSGNTEASMPQPKYPGSLSSSKQDESLTMNEVTITILDGR
uniref:receptor-like serine/threonine-protein kinase SD1-8 n=1 Tax=Erigeron canadensis TaxID=72917 RepID=UPI001CB8C2B5|nr:receptor-like serine/threonine-protein kinase SD1-8 [Erigeron canadensis]